MNYSAQTRDIRHALFNVSAMDELVAEGVYPDLSADLIDAILEQAGRFASDVIAPLNHSGDVTGARLEEGRVKMPPGWVAAYQQWVEDGWGALPGDEDYGGQGAAVSGHPGNVEFRRHGLWHRHRTYTRGGGSPEPARHNRVEGGVSGQTHQRRVDGHHELDREPVRLGLKWYPHQS